MKHIVILAFILLILGCSKSEDLEKATSQNNNASDADGNTYKTVVIGTQTWFAENLKTTKYKDGTAIPLVTDNTAWKNSIIPAYCWYKNDEKAYKDPYGALYNWYAVSTGKLCPTGWHVPSSQEWQSLTTFLGGDIVSGGKLKVIGTNIWLSPNKGATDEVGFSAVPGGVKITDARLFDGLGEVGFYWSRTEQTSAMAYFRMIEFDTSSALLVNEFKITGQSVRCIKD
jgi:uncharacterized protein (TIGR02145 family)